MARVRKNIKLNPVLFIGCEGTSSEFQYFESWAQTEEVLEHYNRIDVYPCKNEKKPKTTPWELFELAKGLLETGTVDFAWIVFDKDNHPKLPETFRDAKLAGINIAFSSRSFEQWVVLHFEKNSAAFNATECKDVYEKPINCGSQMVPNCLTNNCLSGHIRRQGFLPDYSKKKDFDLFNKISERTQIAAVNAAWVRAFNGSSINKVQPSLNGLNPYTDVDQLILKLFDKSQILEWGTSGSDVMAGHWTVNVKIEDANLYLVLSHQFHQAQVINDTFKTTSFFTCNDDLDLNPCVIITQEYLNNDEGSADPLLYAGDKVAFILSRDDKPYFLFKLDGFIKIFVTL